MNQPVEQERNTPGTHEMLSSEDGHRPPPPSPLSGGYLLIVISEPRLETHKAVILQKISKAFLSWDVQVSGIDIEHELALVTALSPEGDVAKSGERLIQNASEHLVTEILIKPQINTLRQCVHNLLSSFTKYRYIIHAGYTFYGNGSWILEDGTFSMGDFINAFHEIEVQRVMRAYEKGIKVDVCCISEGSWNQARINQEPFSKSCRIEINPSDKLTSINTAISDFTDYLDAFIIAQDICDVLQSSDIVGNIRFSRPTLYVFPGGDGDTALFGINGFNMLVDGGFNRGACFWNFVRHLDRLDAVLLTRINNTNIGGMSGIVQRKVKSPVYPQIGHFFSNLQRSRNFSSPDENKDKDPLLIDLVEEGDRLVTNLKKLQLKPHSCYRESNNEPINLYHKVGHGKLDMYVLSPAKDSREVKEFLHRWHSHDVKLFSSGSIGSGDRELNIPVQNLTSICALLVWQPANPEDHVTRILFPGSAPQQKVFEGFDQMKQVNFLRSPVCLMKSILPPTHAGTTVKSMKTKKNNDERISHAVTISSEKIISDNEAKKIIPEMADNEITDLGHKKIDSRHVSQSHKYNDKAVISNQTKGFDMKEKHVRPPAEKLQMKDLTKNTEKSTEILTKNKKLEKGAVKPSEKKSKVMGLEKKTESVKSSPTMPKKILPMKETSTKKNTSNSIFHAATKAPTKILPGKHSKEENNQQIAETKPQTQVAQSRSSVLTAEQPSKMASTEANKVIRKESNKPKAAITVTKQTVETNADQVTAPSVTKKTSASRNSFKKIEDSKKPSKSEDTKNKAAKKSAVIDTAAKELVTASARKSIKSIPHKKIIKNENADSSTSSMTVSNIIRKEGDSNEDEILIIETTEMKPKDVMENVYEENKYLRDEKESEKGTIKDQENNGQIMAVGKCDECTAPSEIKSVPVLLTPEQKEDISDQLRGIISTATEIASSSSAEFQATANNADESHKTEMVQKQDSIESKVPFTLMDKNIEATSVKTTQSFEKGIEIRHTKIEEKYDTEDTKEKSSPIDNILPAKTGEQVCGNANICEPVYERNDSAKVVALKTPDEVADLPIHEEVNNESTPILNREMLKDSVLEQPIVAQVDELQLPEVVTITPTSSPDEKVEPRIISPSSAILLENLRLKTSGIGLSDDDAGSPATGTHSQKEEVLPKVEIPFDPVSKTVTVDEKLENSCSKPNIHSEENRLQKTETKNNDGGSNQNKDFPVTKPNIESSLNLEITSLEDTGSPDAQFIKEVLIEDTHQEQILQGVEIVEEPLLVHSSQTDVKENIYASTNTVSLEDINSLDSQTTRNEIKEGAMSLSSLISEGDTASSTIEKRASIKIAPDSTLKSEAALSPSTTAPCADDEETITVPSSQLPPEDGSENLLNKFPALESISDIISPEKITSSSSLSAAHQKDDTPLQITEVNSKFLEPLPTAEKDEDQLSSLTLQMENVSSQNTEKNGEFISKLQTGMSVSPSEAVQKDTTTQAIESLQLQDNEGSHSSLSTVISHTEIVPDTSSPFEEQANFPESSVPHLDDKDAHIHQSTKEETKSLSPTPAFEKSTTPCTDPLSDDEIEGSRRGSFLTSHKRRESLSPLSSAQEKTDLSKQIQSSEGEKGPLSASIMSGEENLEKASKAAELSSSEPRKQDDTPSIVETLPKPCTTTMLQASDQEMSNVLSSAKSTSYKSISEKETRSFSTAHQEDISQHSPTKMETSDLQPSQSLEKAESYQPQSTELKGDLNLKNNENQQKEAASYIPASPQKEATTLDVGQAAPFGEVQSAIFSENIMSQSAIVESDIENILEQKTSLYPGAVEHENITSQLTGRVETSMSKSAQSLEVDESSSTSEKGDIILETIDTTFSNTAYSSPEKLKSMKSTAVDVPQTLDGEGKHSPTVPVTDRKDTELKSTEVVFKKRHSVDEKARISHSEAIEHDMSQCDIERVDTRVQSSEIEESSLPLTSKCEEDVTSHNVELVTQTLDSFQGKSDSEISLQTEERKEAITSEEPESSNKEVYSMSQGTFPHEDTEYKNVEVTVGITSKIMKEESICSSAEENDHNSAPLVCKFSSTNSETVPQERDTSNSLITSITEDSTSLKNTTLHQEMSTVKLEISTPGAAKLEKSCAKLETTAPSEIQSEDGQKIIIKKEEDDILEAVTSAFDEDSTAKYIDLHQSSSIRISRDCSIELKTTKEINQSDLESGVRRTDPIYVSDISIENFPAKTADNATAKSDPSLDESKLLIEDPSQGRKHDPSYEKEKCMGESFEDENYQKHPRLSTDEYYSQPFEPHPTTRGSEESTSIEEIDSTSGSLSPRKKEDKDSINSSAKANEHITSPIKMSIQPENTAEVDGNLDKTLSPVLLKDEELRREEEKQNLDDVMVHRYSTEEKLSKNKGEESLNECAGYSPSLSTITHSVYSKDGGEKRPSIDEERINNSSSKPTLGQIVVKADSTEKSPEKTDLRESLQPHPSRGDPEKELKTKKEMEVLLQQQLQKNETYIRSPESTDLSHEGKVDTSLLQGTIRREEMSSALKTQLEKTEAIHESISSKYSQEAESQKDSSSNECTQSTEERDATHSKHLETQISSTSIGDAFKTKKYSKDDEELNLKLETTIIKGSHEEVDQSEGRSSLVSEIQETVSIADQKENESKKKFGEDSNTNVQKETNKEIEDLKIKSEVEIIHKGLDGDEEETAGPDRNDPGTEVSLSKNLIAVIKDSTENREEEHAISTSVSPLHGRGEFQQHNNVLEEESKNYERSISCINTTDILMESTHAQSSLSTENNDMGTSTQNLTLNQTLESSESMVGFPNVDEKNIECNQKHKESLPSGKDMTRINSVPEIKLTVEKMDVSAECMLPMTSTTSISATTVTTIFRPTIHNEEVNNEVGDKTLFQEDDVLNVESDNSFQRSHHQSENRTFSETSSNQITDTYTKNTQDPIDIMQEHERSTDNSTFRDSDRQIVVQTIENFKDDNLNHGQTSTAKYEEVKQTESHVIFSQEMKMTEKIQTDKIPQINLQDQDLTSTSTSIASEARLDLSLETMCSKDPELCSPQVRTSIVAIDQKTIQEDDFNTKRKIEDASIPTSKVEKEDTQSTENEGHTYRTMTFSTVTSSKLEEKLPVSITSEEEKDKNADQKNTQSKKDSTVHLPETTTAFVEQYPSTADQSFSEYSMTEKEISHLHEEATSPALQLDTSAMYVKFTSSSVDSTSQKIVSMEDADMKKRSITPVLSSKANSEDTVAVPEEFNAMLDGKDLVAKTISLPILDSKAVSSSETDFSKSYPCLEKISTPTTLSDTSSFDEKLPSSDLKSKSVSLPVIKRPDDSDKYMELPHLHKIENLEDLTSMTVTEEVNSGGTIETITTTVSTISETTEQISASTLMHESCVTFSNIDPIKEADEPVSEDELLHSQDPASEKPTNKDIHCSTVMTSSMYESNPLSRDEHYSGIERVSAHDIPFSMTQSIYGGFSSDEEDQSNMPSETAIVPPEEKKPSIEQVAEKGKEPKDPIHDWGKPLGLPLADDASNFSSLLFWNTLETWGKPYGLPSPGPPPPSTLLTSGRNNDSNGDIELNLKPINKMMNQKTTVKSSSGQETLKTRDASTTRKSMRNSKQVTPLYVDLAYIPHHGNPYYANLEFFKRIRARYYVFSSSDPSKDVLNALLEAKKLWDNPDLEVTIIPTYDTDVLGYWIAENEEILSNLKIDLAPSASRCTINLQDHDTSCSAYRLEF